MPVSFEAKTAQKTSTSYSSGETSLTEDAKPSKTIWYVLGGIVVLAVALFALLPGLGGAGGSNQAGLSVEPIRCTGTNLGNSVTYVSSSLSEPVEVFVKVGYFLEGALVGQDEEWATVQPGGKSQIITGENIGGILFSECKVLDFGKYTGGGE